MKKPSREMEGSRQSGAIPEVGRVQDGPSSESALPLKDGQRTILERELFSIIDPAIGNPKDGVNQFLCQPSPSNTDIAIYHSVMGRFKDDAGYLERGRERVVDAIETIFKMPFRLQHIGGHVGVLWLAELVDPEILAPRLKKEILNIISSHLDDEGATKLEFMHGLSGVGVALQHFEYLPEGEECLDKIARKVIDRAVWDQHGCYWPMAEKEGGEVVGIGYAHGMNGVMDFLAMEYLRGVRHPGLLKSIEGGCRWLQHWLTSLPLPVSPLKILVDTREGVSILGARENRKLVWWCNGMVGLIIPFLRAWKATGNVQWREFALGQVPDLCPDEPGVSGVTAAGLCHGYLGNVNILLGAHALYPADVLLDAAGTWLDKFTSRIESFGPQEPASIDILLLKYNWDGHAPDLHDHFVAQMKGWNRPGFESGYMMGFAGIGATLAMLLAGRKDQWGFERIMFP